jgi:epoxyqueuosine reductase
MDTQRIRDWAASRGMVSRVLPVDALESVRIRLEHLAADGLLDADFVRGSLGGFRYLDGCSVKSPRSLILLALPRPAHVIAFRHAGCDLELILPPTYVRYSQTFDLVRDWFLDDFGLGHDQADLVSAPLKSLSAAGGLIRYGKNNVGYIRGLGSYFQLIGLAVNFP